MGLVVELFRSQRVLRVRNGVEIVEQIFLTDQSIIAVYRDTAVVLKAGGKLQSKKFRIRFSNTADRLSFCMAVREFITVEENLPSQPSTGESSFSQTRQTSDSFSSQPRLSFSAQFSPVSKRPRLQPSELLTRGGSVQDLQATTRPFKSEGLTTQRQMRDGETQTEHSNIWLESDEQIQRRLSRLLTDPACQQMVERMLKILSKLDMPMQSRRSYNTR
ncbi:hypothetical protein KIN20_013996 [Parelaphostrongylus tenuis]|uniref:Uncharacterized protein n=1 Tax=Parelaphostrongylus tenuis TaxID=148309 RepID=A0AAD5MGE9_PARTN|nr:hypothetical protein KIN20_013996 [Parelaphostrongylus tenuis]